MGLMFREQMGDDEGMLFIFPTERHNSFWMRNTLLPLDMFFIDSAWNVVGVVENAEPLTESPRAVDGHVAVRARSERWLCQDARLRRRHHGSLAPRGNREGRSMRDASDAASCDSELLLDSRCSLAEAGAPGARFYREPPRPAPAAGRGTARAVEAKPAGPRPQAAAMQPDSRVRADLTRSHGGQVHARRRRSRGCRRRARSSATIDTSLGRSSASSTRTRRRSRWPTSSAWRAACGLLGRARRAPGSSARSTTAPRSTASSRTS